MITYPQARTCPYHPSPAYEPLRHGDEPHQVTLYNGHKAWVVAKHAQARALLIDHRLSPDRRRDGFPILAQRGEILRSRPPAFLTMDDPEHAHRRRMYISEFTVKKLNRLRPDIERIVDDTIDRMLTDGPPTDLVQAFALPVPSLVISQMLGVPYADHEFFERASNDIVTGTSPEVTANAFAELTEYLAKLAANPPHEGVIARLASTGELSTAEIATDALILLAAGHDTTASTIALGVITLLAHPEQLAAMRAGQNVVEELLRYLSVVDGGVLRVALADIEVGGVTIRAGEGVLISTSLANRDPEVFPEPDTFDVARTNRSHIAFGYGIHQCLGQNLARVELDVAVPALFRRIPTLRLDSADLELRGSAGIQGIHRLPVTW